ncbi:MAG TPA: DUF58 domain-containing protein [Gammaproteobacteria bacterium]|nr:DUF58 domain-containing protein [Gammaproteobacteria bacterium]
MIAATQPEDGIITISAASLIALHREAHKLPLRSRKINAQISGNYLSAFKGRGMEFDEARLYQPGDDIRAIDWRLTARSGKTHTKLYREERERPVLLWVDYRQPMFFGTQNCYKSVIAARAAALLAWSSAQHGDRLGGLIFSEQDHIEMRPQRGQAATLHFIQQLAQHSAWQQQAQKNTQQDATLQASHALNRLRSVAKPGSMIFMISDFRHIGTQHQGIFAQLAKHNDLALLFVSDPMEAQLPGNGIFRFSNGDKEVSLNTRDRNTRHSYQQRFDTHRDNLNKLCRKLDMRFVDLSTGNDIISTLHNSLGLTKR